VTIEVGNFYLVFASETASGSPAAKAYSCCTTIHRIKGENIMTSENAARFFKDVQQAQANQERLKASSDPETFILLAAARGYTFTVEDLPTQIGQLSDEEVAAIFNPGSR
jgi:predicted ribosomally synthesized peptide with nif11-like leader